MRRGGQGTIIALILIVLFIAAFIGTLYMINTSFQLYMDTSKKALERLSEKKRELLIVYNVYIDDESHLRIKVGNNGENIIHIVSIWINNTHISLENRSIFLSPTQTLDLDTGYIANPSEKYLISIVSDRGRIYYASYPFSKHAEWKLLSYAPTLFPSGSTAAYGLLTSLPTEVHPSDYSIEEGHYVSGDVNSLYSDDDDYLVIDSIPYGNTYTTYYPSSYITNLGGVLSGDIRDLKSNDSRYFVIESIPTEFTDTLYLHSETYSIASQNYYMLKTIPADGTRKILTKEIRDQEWHLISTSIYPLNGINLSQGIWRLYYRVEANITYPLDGWKYRIPIYIHENTGENLTDYQIKIVLNQDNFNYGDANPDGSDIRFTDSDGYTLLDYWIENWNTTGTSIVWVKIPLIPGGSVKTIYLYYGNPNATYDNTHYGLTKVMETLPSSDGNNYMIYYEVWNMKNQLFNSENGVQQGWHGDDSRWKYTLPFAFPYYSESYTNIYICSNGFIGTTYSGTDYSSTINELKKRGMIAPFWADLMTNIWYDRSYDIFISNSYSDQYGNGVYIRWHTKFYYYNGDQNFAVVLYNNGLIRLDYGSISGSSSTDDTPVIGISKGDRKHYTLITTSDNEDSSNWNNHNSIMLWPRKKASEEPTVEVGTPYIGMVSVDIDIINSNGNLVQNIGNKTGSAVLYSNDTWNTLAGSFNFPGYSSNEGEYLVVNYYFKSTPTKRTDISLDIDDPRLQNINQTHVLLASSDLPTSYSIQIDFKGYANTARIWNNLTVGLDLHYNLNDTDSTIRLYNYNKNRYANNGEDGYLEEIFDNAPNDHYYEIFISSNPSYFRNSTNGEWRLRLTGFRNTVFNEKLILSLDLIFYKVNYVNKYKSGIIVYYNGLNSQDIQFINYTLIISSNRTTELSLYIFNYTSNAWERFIEGDVSTSESRFSYLLRENTEELMENGTMKFKMILTLESENASLFREYIEESMLTTYGEGRGVIFIGRGATHEFYEYIPSENAWIQLSSAPFIWNNITRITFAASRGVLYAMTNTSIYSYDPLNNRWKFIVDLIENASVGGSIAYSDAYPNILIYLPGGTTHAYKLDLSTKNWEVISPIPEAPSKYSLSIGDNIGEVYVAIDGLSGGFYLYNISSDKWIKLNNTPSGRLSGMTTDGEYIYMGDIDGGLYKYIPSENTWVSLTPSLPVRTSGPGNRLVSDGIYLYYIRMDYTSEIYYIRISELATS